jgi:pimeloyl-ACP methyl ester carboxylesterase
MTRMMLSVLGSVAALAMGAAGAQAQTAPTGKNNYADKATWLCWTGKPGDACAIDLTTTVVKADGSESVETFKADPKAPVDCFYVYPTVSNDPGVVSDMNAGPEELSVVKAQLARFGSKCRIYAPLYRQFTLTALRAGQSGKPMPGANDPAARAVGYNDVLDAWTYYLAHENKGRGVVLIGHSQGSGVLTQLIAKEIDGKPVQAKVISAILMGTRLPIDKGKDTGLFKAMPLCHSPSQTGCVIAYASFRDTVPPPANSLFGKAPAEGQIAACANPANLAGGKGELHSYLSNSPAISGQAMPKTVWAAGKPNPTTPFISVPGLLTSECVEKNGFSYLEVHVNAVPGDPRTDTIEGDVVGADGQVNAAWGLHLIDANLAMGNLVDIVGTESKAYLAKKK